MFKFLRKVAEKLHIIKPKRVKPKPSAIRPVLRPPQPRQSRILNQRVINYILDEFSHANAINVNNRVQYMTPEEMRWTLQASRRDIQNKARLKPDREDDDGEELNPWWYK